MSVCVANSPRLPSDVDADRGEHKASDLLKGALKAGYFSCCGVVDLTSMCDHLAHRYFDTAHAILQATVDEDLPDLEHAVRRSGGFFADLSEDRFRCAEKVGEFAS